MENSKKEEFQTQEYEDRYAQHGDEPGKMAIASLVLGIVSIVLSCTYINVLTGVISIIFGALHLRQYRTRRGMALTGIVLSIISIIVLIALVAIGISVINSNPDMQMVANFI